MSIMAMALGRDVCLNIKDGDSVLGGRCLKELSRSLRLVATLSHACASARHDARRIYALLGSSRQACLHCDRFLDEFSGRVGRQLRLESVAFPRGEETLKLTHRSRLAKIFAGKKLQESARYEPERLYGQNLRAPWFSQNRTGNNHVFIGGIECHQQ